MFEQQNSKQSIGDFSWISADISPDNADARVRYLRFLRSALRHLPPRQREAITLYFYEGYKIPAIAEQLHVAPSTVSRRLTAAKKSLRDLAKLFGEAGFFPS